MTFHEEKEKFWECDSCGDREPLEFEFGETWRRLKAEGWRAVRNERDGGWFHSCPECMAEKKARRDEWLAEKIPFFGEAKIKSVK